METTEKKTGRKGNGHAGGQHGKGRLFQRGKVWWLQYYSRGQQVRESSHSRMESVAERLLMKRLVAADEGTLPAPQRPMKYEEMRERLVKARLLEGENPKEIEYSLARLDEFFSGISTSVIDEDKINEFKLTRKATGGSHATINRALVELRKMFNLSAKRLKNVPKVKLFKEPPARQGFLTDEDYKRLWSKLPPYLQPITEFAYLTGMRQGELEELTWKKVDRVAGVIRLEPEDTKNKEGREIHYGLLPELAEIMARLWETTKDASGLVFTRPDGSPLACFRKAWVRACIKSGLGRMCWECPVCRSLTEVEKQPWPPEPVPEEIPSCVCGKTCRWHYEGLIFHDLRRTAVRNLRRAGVPESIAMMLSGHKDRGVFERYNIKDSDDQRRAMKALYEFRLVEQRKLEQPAARPN